MSFLDGNMTHPFIETCEDAATPLTLMYAGSLISCLITILFVHASCCGHTGKIVFWMVMFILFMIQLYADWLDLNAAVETFKIPGDLFNCYARIVVNSPNFKWSVCSTLCSLSTAVFQKPEKSKKIKFSDAFNKKKLWKRFKNDPISEVFLICPFIITSIMTIPIFFTHVLWGQIEYCWFTMLILMTSDICITFGKCVCPVRTKYDDEGVPLKKTKLQIIITSVFLLWQLGCYSMVYYVGTVLPVNFVSLYGSVPLSDNYTLVYDDTPVAAFYTTADMLVCETNETETYNITVNMLDGTNETYDYTIVLCNGTNDTTYTDPAEVCNATNEVDTSYNVTVSVYNGSTLTDTYNDTVVCDWIESSSTNAYMEAVFATIVSRNLTEYMDEMFFGLNATIFTKIEFAWVVI
jgi:hypothetical protein